MPTQLAPISNTSTVILTSTGSANKVASGVPFGMYTGSAAFLSGAAVQVGYVYKKLGGDVVDIELTPSNVYASYEEAVLEYSYLINLHQSKNVLADSLGATTGAFDHMGNLVYGDALSGSNIELRYPRFQYAPARKIGDAAITATGLGGTERIYSASFSPGTDRQDYDLQTIIETASDSGTDDAGRPVVFAGLVDNQRVIISRVYYRSPRAMWRFYGYYGGVGVVGNYSTYGQFADDSTFEIIPTWQNKMQAIMYEDSLFTRTSHYSYEIKDNFLRLYPTPSYWGLGPLDRVWVEFFIDVVDPWKGNTRYKDGVKGINNVNTLPFDNIPYESINSMGKQWIRKYSIALCKEMLGQIRGKFITMPIPGESVTLNHSELLAQAKEEQQELREKLMEMLETITYKELTKSDAEITEAVEATFKSSPLPIFVG